MRKFMNALIAVSALSVLVATSQPGVAAADGHAPQFTQDDRTIIQRNELLRRSLKAHPETVRQILDLILAHSGADQAPAAPTGAGGEKLPGDSEADRPAFDPKRNPDLDHLSGSSPEATHDLFQLLKKVGSTSKPRPSK
jgi:hypothetical protein